MSRDSILILIVTIPDSHQSLRAASLSYKVEIWPIWGHEAFHSILSPGEHNLGLGLVDGTPRMQNSGFWNPQKKSGTSLKWLPVLHPQGGARITKKEDNEEKKKHQKG